jgi:hypothetical protein
MGGETTAHPCHALGMEANREENWL